MPGTDFPAALRMTFDLVADLPYLPELPQRGPWAGMIGRALGLPEAPMVDFLAGQWHRASSAGSDQRRARAQWRDDVEMLAEYAHDYQGRLRLTTVGPWTLASNLAGAHSGLALGDGAARSDLAEGLGYGIAETLDAIQKLIPRAEMVLQIDEPSLPGVAAGAVPTAGGYFRHRAVDLPELFAGLARLTRAVADRTSEVVLHSCAAWAGPDNAWPLRELRHQAGIAAVSFDIDQLSAADLDALGEALDDDLQLFAGVLPTAGPLRNADQLTRRTAELLNRLGRPDLDAIVLTPACGVSGWTPAQVSAGFASLATTATRLEEDFQS